MLKLMIEKINRIRPALILIFIPIFFTLLFGAAFSPIFVEDIPIIIYDQDQSSASREIIDSFSNCPMFEIPGRAETQQELEDGLLTAKFRGGFIIPEGFEKDLAAKRGSQIIMFMDGTNFLIGNNTMLYANKIFTDRNIEIQQGYLGSGDMVPYVAEKNLETLSLVDRTLYNPQMSYFYYIFAGLLGIFLQQTYLNVLTPFLIDEKNRLKSLPADKISKKIAVKRITTTILQYTGFSLISFFSCLLLSHWMFTYPLRGNLLLTILIQIVFMACLTGICFVLAAFFDVVTHCVQFAMFLAIPTMLTCGYAWPEYMMPAGFATVMKAIWPLYYFANPLKELMVKGAGFAIIQDYILGGIFFAAFWLPVGIWLYRQKIRRISVS